MTEPTSGVTITLKDVYDLLNELRNQATQSNTRIEMITARNINADTMHQDHESRLRALEKWRYAIPATAVTAAGGVATAITAILLKH